MICEEKMRLVEEYTRAASGLSHALTELHLKAWRSDTAEHARIEGIVAECEIKVDQARRAFEEHKFQHGC